MTISMRVLFKSASAIVHTASKPKIIHGTSVSVDNGKILSVGEPPQEFVPERTIDCSNMILMPGFINAHTHSPLSLFRGGGEDCSLETWLSEKIWPFEGRHTSESCYWGTMLNTAESIRNGITCINDMYIFAESVAKAYVDSGIRALVTPTLTDSLVSADSLLMEKIISMIKEFAGNPLVRIGIGPHSIYTCNDEILHKATEIHDKYNIPIHIHIAETMNEVKRCRNSHNGLSPLQLADKFGLVGCDSLLAHCTFLDEQDMKLISDRKSCIVHCPKSNLKLGSGIAPIQKYLDEELCVAIGTDSSASNNNQDILEESRIAALLQKGINHNPKNLPLSDLFKMSVYSAAPKMGFNNIGEIRPGADADLILIDTREIHWTPMQNPLANLFYSSMPSDVLLTMVGGRILYENGEFPTLDIEKIKHESARFANKLHYHTVSGH